MPYITQQNKMKYEESLKFLTDDMERNQISKGEFTYILYKLCQGYREVHGIRYNTLNDIIGTLHCTSQEFYRREIVPYENMKMSENGDA